jgi:hypothetical protein
MRRVFKFKKGDLWNELEHEVIIEFIAKSVLGILPYEDDFTVKRSKKVTITIEDDT